MKFQKLALISALTAASASAFAGEHQVFSASVSKMQISQTMDLKTNGSARADFDADPVTAMSFDYRSINAAGDYVNVGSFVTVSQMDGDLSERDYSGAESGYPVAGEIDDGDAWGIHVGAGHQYALDSALISLGAKVFVKDYTVSSAKPVGPFGGSGAPIETDKTVMDSTYAGLSVDISGVHVVNPKWSLSWSAELTPIAHYDASEKGARRDSVAGHAKGFGLSVGVVRHFESGVLELSYGHDSLTSYRSVFDSTDDELTSKQVSLTFRAVL